MFSPQPQPWTTSPATPESEQRCHKVVNTAPVMLWVSGPDRLCTFCNQSVLDFTGRSLEEELGDGWVSAVHPEDRDACQAVYAAAFDMREKFQMEYRLKRADGVYRWVVIRGVPLFAPGGVFEGYVGSCVDISDIKLAQEVSANRQRLESLGTLAAGIAHDFNNLMGSIIADSEIALSEINADTPTGKRFQSILRVAFRASEIGRQLMVYSGTEKAEFQPVRIPSLIQDMAELLMVSTSKRATLRMQFEQNLPPVIGNPTQIQQIVMNLIINASEALGGDEGEVTLTVSRVTGGKELAPRSAHELAAGQYVRLEVSDTGCGITSEAMDRIFDPFFSTKSTGRGLGLAVVYGAVRAHNGAIDVNSSPGKGTTFRVFFPIHSA